MVEKSLYWSSESASRYRYTQEALELEQRAREALTPLIQSYEAQGYSPREIGGLLHALVEEFVTESILSAGLPGPSATTSEG